MTQNSINNSASIIDVDNIRLDGNTISSTDTNGNIVLAPDGNGTVSVTTAPIVPSGDRADSLGSATNSWDNVYADGLTFDDGTNIMSTYEKGTFTPTLTYVTESVAPTYTSRNGVFWKIGHIVYFNMTMLLSNKGTGSGNASITGAPFTSSADIIRTQQWVVAADNYTYRISSHTMVFGRIGASTTVFDLLDGGGSANSSRTRYNEINNTTNFRMSGMYFAST